MFSIAARWRFAIGLLFMTMLAAVASPAAAQPGAPVTVNETREIFTISNGIITAMISKRTGDLLSMTYKGTETVEKDSGGHSGGYWSHDTTGGVQTVARISIDPTANGGERAEVSVKGISGGVLMGHGPGTRPEGDVALDLDIRYAIERGQPGIYTYQILEHQPDYATGFMAEARFAIKLEDFFTDIFVDRERSGPYPLLNEGIDKYVYTALQWEERVFGWTSPKRKLGWFMMNPSAEYLSGGPTKAEFLAHGTAPTVLNYWKSSHYGGANVHFLKGEKWSKVIGPIFFYVNEGETSQDMFADAQRRLAKEAARWPYGWVEGGNYRHRAERTEVKGRLALDDLVLGKRFPGKITVGLAHPPYEALTMFGKRTLSWDQDGKYYQFWNRVVAPDGSFSVPNVVPGHYTLYAYAEGVLGTFEKADVVVPEGSGVLDLGTLAWKPVRKGDQIFEIGTADRSGAEFAHGKRYFETDVIMRYPKMFPNGTTYEIGTSMPGKDWYFLHAPNSAGRETRIAPFVGIAGKGAATPYRVLFPLDRAGKGVATLRVAITATGASELGIAVNGRDAGVLKLHRPDGAITRHQMYGTWYEVEFPFDASLLKKGRNELIITVPEGSYNAGVIYDYLRLELDRNAKLPSARPIPPETASLNYDPPPQPDAKPSPWPTGPDREAKVAGTTFTLREENGRETLIADRWGGRHAVDVGALSAGEGALIDWSASPDGRKVALVKADVDEFGYHSLRIVDRDTAATADVIRWVKAPRPVWSPDGKGFYYAGFGRPSEDELVRRLSTSNQIYYHRLGSPQDEDEVIYRSDRGNTAQSADLTGDGRWLVIQSTLDDDRGDAVVLIDRAEKKPAPWQLVATFIDHWRFAGKSGSRFYFMTDREAPKGRVVAFDIDQASNLPRTIVPQREKLLRASSLQGTEVRVDYTGPDARPLEVAEPQP